MKKVFVTGAAGFLGRHIINELLEKEFSVIALVRSTIGISYLDHKNIEIMIGDIRDNAVIEAGLKKADYVIHAAATFAGRWENFYNVNVLATEEMLRSAAKNKIEKFIYVSTISVYRHITKNAGKIITEDSEYELDENHTFYSKSKFDGEKVVRKIERETKLPCIIVRPGSLFGPHGQLFPARMGLGLGRNKILLIGDTKTHIAISYIENVAKDIVGLLKTDVGDGKSFNSVESQTISRKDYFDKLKTVVDPKISKIWVPLWFIKLAKFSLGIIFKVVGQKAPLSDVDLDMLATTYTYSNERINQLLKLEDKIDHETSLDRTLTWLKDRRIPKRDESIINGKVTVVPDKKLNVGIVGCGVISEEHIKKIKKISAVENISLADPDTNALDSIAQKFGLSKKYNDYKEMITKEKPDVVHICTPPQYHAEVTQFAAQNNCNILVEKPMALDAAQAQKMVAAAADNNVKLCVMHNMLYDDVMLKARKIIAQGELGKITFIESWYGIQFGGDAADIDIKTHWKFKMPGLIYQDFMPHAMYIVTDLLPDAKLSYAVAKHAGKTTGVSSDELKVMIENEDTMGLINVSLTTSPRQVFMNIYGTAGTMMIDFLNQYVGLHNSLGPIPASFGRVISTRKFGKVVKRSARKNFIDSLRGKYDLFQGTERLINLFYRSIQLDTPTPVTGLDGLELTELMDDVWKDGKII